MAASLPLKVYTALGEYVAATRYYDEAAILVAVLGQGSTVRDGHSKQRTIYTQGIDGDAAESYDAAADKMRLAAERL